MKSAILYSYDTVAIRGCCRFLNPKYAAITAAIYTLVSKNNTPFDQRLLK